MQGEFEAFSHIPYEAQQSILPLFEMPRFTDTKRNSVKYRDLPTQTEQFLSDVAVKIKAARGELPTLIDINRWRPDATIETGEHVLSYVINRLHSINLPAIPIIGYDRWDDSVYRNVLVNLNNPQQKYCLRLESSYAFEDMREEDFFLETIDGMIASMGIDTHRCGVILDFGDVSKLSTIDIQDTISRATSLLLRYEFEYISIAGSSITELINGMVSEHDSTGIVVRREMIAWQASFQLASNTPLVFGDYGVVFPNLQEDIIAPDANGKIRYTFSKNYFIARGHSRRQGNKGQQMWDLSQMIIDSPQYMGGNRYKSPYSYGSCRNL